MSRRQLELIVTLPWLAASIVMLLMTRIEGESRSAQLGLLGSSAICFSIGCLARTSLALHDLSAAKVAAAKAAAGAEPQERPSETLHGS